MGPCRVPSEGSRAEIRRGGDQTAAPSRKTIIFLHLTSPASSPPASAGCTSAVPANCIPRLQVYGATHRPGRYTGCRRYAYEASTPASMALDGAARHAPCSGPQDHPSRRRPGTADRPCGGLGNDGDAWQFHCRPSQDPYILMRRVAEGWVKHCMVRPPRQSRTLGTGRSAYSATAPLASSQDL